MRFSQFDAQTKALLIAALDAAWLAVGDISDWSAERRANTTRRFTDHCSLPQMRENAIMTGWLRPRSTTLIAAQPCTCTCSCPRFYDAVGRRVLWVAKLTRSKVWRIRPLAN